MKLVVYLNENDLNFSEAARQLGATHQAVRCWVLGERTPSPEFMIKIFRWSHGSVTPNDFYELPPVQSPGGGHGGEDKRRRSSVQLAGGLILPGQLDMFRAGASA